MKRKIVVTLQTSEKDCGPACLSSIIQYYNGFVPLETIKIDSKINAEGTNFYDLLKAANKYGFCGNGYNIEKENIYDEKRIFPIICQVIIRGCTHFIVLYKIDNTNALIMDPACGKKSISINDFFDMWTGLILELYPRNKILVINAENKMFDIIYLIFCKERKLFIAIITTSFLLTITSIIFSFYLKITLDNINNDVSFLNFLFISFFLITLFKVVLFYIRNYYELNLGKNISVYFYKDFFNHLFNLPSNIVLAKPIGELITRFNDLSKIQNILLDFIISMFLDFILTVLAIPLLIAINYKMFLVLIISLVLYSVSGFIYSLIIHKKIINNKNYESDFSTIFSENIKLFKNTKYLSKTSCVLKKIESNFSKYLYDTYLIDKTNSYSISFKNCVNEFSYFAINLIGIYEVLNNNLTITSLITFNALMTIFLEPIKNMINNIPKYKFIKTSFFKINEFMAIKEENLGLIQKLNNFNITFENVTFGYNDFEKILNKYNLKIKSKEHVFLYGKSGTGKSTLCKLLLKEEASLEGNIFIGESNLKDLSNNTLRSNIVYISQDEKLFSGTIKENIEFFRDVNLDRLNESINMVSIKDVFKYRGLSLESYISSDYTTLSGGEKQRVVLARAILNDFNILIIDEALSEVDLETEVKIIKNLQKTFKDKIIIYISHKDLSKYFKRVIKFG